MAPLRYDYLVLALGAQVNFFGVEGAAEHAFPMYTLADAMRLKEHVLQRWEAADRDPALVDDGALNVVVVGGGATGVETAGALAELYRSNFAEDYPRVPQEKARLTLVEAGPALFSMFKQDIRDLHEDRRSRSAASRSCSARSSQSVDADARHAQVGHRASRAHARLGRGPAGEPARRSRWASSCSAATACRSEPDLSLAGPPRGVRRRRHRVDHRREDEQVLPQLGSVAMQTGEHAGENIARRLKGKEAEPFALPRQGHDGDDRPRRGGRADAAAAAR